jgi:hypothetical protein
VSGLKRDGWAVFLFINAHMLTDKQQWDWSAFPNHYVYVSSKSIDIRSVGDDLFVSFTCTSWGRAIELSGLPWESMRKNYYGHVAAKN